MAIEQSKREAELQRSERRRKQKAEAEPREVKREDGKRQRCADQSAGPAVPVTFDDGDVPMLEPDDVIHLDD